MKYCSIVCSDQRLRQSRQARRFFHNRTRDEITSRDTIFPNQRSEVGDRRSEVGPDNNSGIAVAERQRFIQPVENRFERGATARPFLILSRTCLTLSGCWRAFGSRFAWLNSTNILSGPLETKLARVCKPDFFRVVRGYLYRADS